MNEPSVQRLEALLLSWEEGEISEIEQETLVSLLEGDAHNRRAAVAHFALSASLAEQLRETSHEERVVRQLQSMARRDKQLDEAGVRRRRGLVVAATVLLVLVATALVYRIDLRFPPFEGGGNQGAAVAVEQLRPTIVAVFGDVQSVGDGPSEGVVKGTTLRLGEALRTARHSHATLRYADGTTIELDGDTEIGFVPHGARKQCFIRRGGIYAAVAPQPPGAPLVINPGDYDQVEVVGTRFEFSRGGGGESVVRVETGKVRFGAKENGIVVAERQQSMATSVDGPAVPTPIQSEQIWRGWGRGLRGDYFDSEKLRGQRVSRIDPQIDFHWAKSDPDLAAIEGPFSARWTGEIEAPRTEEFTLYVVAHYGVRLWVNGEKVVDNWASMGSESRTAPFAFQRGKRYPIRIEYWDRHGDAQLQLLWSSPSTPKSIVDQQWLHPAPTDASDITGYNQR